MLYWCPPEILKQEAPVTQSIRSGQMMQMLSYKTVLLAQTGIRSGIHPMALRSIPPQSSASSISASTTSHPQWPYVHIPTRSHGNIRIELKARAAAFKERETNPDAYKKSHYAVRRTIKQAKSQYRIKNESYYTGSDARRMWQGLKTISWLWTTGKGGLNRPPLTSTRL